jgi:hypothetical protein
MGTKTTFKNLRNKINIFADFRFFFIAAISMAGFTAHCQTYCQPLLDCTDDDLISNVTLSTLTNSSSCGAGGYNNFTTLAAPALTAGTSYPISVTVGDGWSNEAVSIWIDYNSNGTFESSEFTFIGVGSGSVVSGSIAIPATVAAGNKRMRVRVAAVGESSATSDMSCDEDDEYGETEDYTVNIQVIAGTNDPGISKLTVYRNNDMFHIYSSGAAIDQVEIYDLSGKMIYTQKGLTDEEVSINALPFSNQLLVLKVQTADGNITTQKVVN